ncbi:hypothetical protein ABW19_dt0200447 [Dactylella cylindrospora]|nr:hypothetical protein ABW19_dt0200447 [Dactylella cylindrospora]
MLQCLYYSKQFREAVINYPQKSLFPGGPNGAISANPKLSRTSTEPAVPNGKAKVGAGQPAPLARRGSTPAPTTAAPGPPKPEDKDSPEAKKKAALAAGPILNVEAANSKNYGMDETLFTAMKDLFESVVNSESRTGVVSPQRFVEVLKMKNELFRSQMHQDAHEFFNYVLNEVIENVEDHAKTANQNKTESSSSLVPDTTMSSADSAKAISTASGSTTGLHNTGWVHDLFEGALTSETKCLTCENVSRRDEPFLDLSIDLEKHSSVTSCLRNFSASEMLCERNKFHCDVCGGLQEAEKRMKIKRLPKVLALHLKRFKYMEELGRHQKLFHRVVYPYHLRLFNTTDDAEDPDRLYELYAVIIHIGGGPYHGHYVAIIKSEEHGWLLYDDEMVEPVDKSFVRNFFGDKPGLACAYVLFYQETTLEAVERENMMEQARAAAKNTKHAKSDVKEVKKKTSKEKINGHANGHVIPVPTEEVPDVPQAEGPKTPTLGPQPKTPSLPPVPSIPSSFLNAKTPTTEAVSPVSPVKSKKEREREQKEREKEAKHREKEEKEREKQAKKEGKERGKEAKHKDKEEKENGSHGLSRFRPASMSMSSKKAFAFMAKEREKEKEKEGVPPLPVGSPHLGDSTPTSQNPPTPGLLPSPFPNLANGTERRDTFDEKQMNGGFHKEDKKNGKEKEGGHHRATKMLRKKLSILG